MTHAFRKNYIVAVAMIAAAFFAIVLTPRADENAEIPDFEAMIPKEFGEWRMMDTPITQTNLSPQDGDDTGLAYDAVVARLYKHTNGNIIQLAVAYVRNQKQERKIHRPELCYYSQGYQVKDLGVGTLEIGKKSIFTHRLLTRQITFLEPVTYWIRVGNGTVQGPWDMRLKLLWDGLRGKNLDGTLVRISSIVRTGADPIGSFEVQRVFAETLANELSPDALKILIGSI